MPEGNVAESVSQQVTRLLGTSDWLIIHSGHHIAIDDDLDALQLAEDARASEAGDTEWDRQHAPHDPRCISLSRQCSSRVYAVT